MAKRMTEREVFRMAIHDAIDWNLELLSGLHDSDPHKEVVRKQVNRMREVRDKYFGKPRQMPWSKADLVPIMDLRKMMKDQPK